MRIETAIEGMLDLLNWSQPRLLSTLAVWIAIAMEPVSWMTSQVPPCMVNPENYSNYYAEHQECPTFHVFLIKFTTAILEKLGDPNWVIAIFTVVLASSTIGLWIATKGLYDTGEKQIAVAKESADAAKAAADAASLSARAAIALQLPIIRVRPDSLGHGVTQGEKTIESCDVKDTRQFNCSDQRLNAGGWCSSIQDGMRRPGCRGSSSLHC
jgi:hypothetical protein